FENDSVDEALASHVIEHLKPAERIFFVNELYRVLKVGAKATIVTPHWCSARAMGDLTHEWPPVSEWWYFYLNAAWRERELQEADHGYLCDFDYMWQYGMHPTISVRNQEFQQFALAYYKEAAQDLHATLTKRG